MGLLDSVFGGILGAVQLGKAGGIHPQWQQYQTSQYAKDNLTNAENAYNGRMAGASTLEQNILANQANQTANVAHTATDGSQALAVQAGMQGQTNQAFHNLQTQEAQNKYQLLNNLNLANTGMVAEGDKQYQSQLQKYLSDVQQQNALTNAGVQNIAGAVGGLGSSALGYGLTQKSNPSGGFSNMLPFLL